MSNLALTEPVRLANAGSKNTKIKTQSNSVLIGYIFSSICLLTGGALFQLLYSSFSIWALIFGFLIFCTLGAGISRSGPIGMHACILTYSICVLVSSLAQSYSSDNFNKVMSTLDANYFYDVVLNQSYNTMQELSTVVNAPLAVYIWKFIYQFIDVSESGPLGGILFNASLMGIAGALTIKSANILFGGDFRRLHKTSILFSTCGLVWLFGAVFLRDGFALFFNSLVLWALLNWLNKPSTIKFILATCATSISAFAMEYIREGSSHLFIGLAAIAIGVGFIRGKNPVVKLMIFGFALIIMIIGYGFISNQVDSALGVAEYRGTQYSSWATQGSRSDSLGVAFIASQPLPIKATVGSIYMLLQPIPAWGYLQPGLPEYLLIKGYHAVYMLIIIPLLISGIRLTFKLFLNRKKRNLNYVFIVIYFLATLMIVAVTSSESRHLGQFASSMVLLAAIPRTETKIEKRTMRDLRITWIVIVAAIYLAWAALKFLR